MKTQLYLVLAAAMAYSLYVLAEPSFDAAKLGRMRGVLDVCSMVNPQQASTYFLQMKEMIGEATKQSVDDAAKTEEYQQAYQSVTGQLREMGQDEMIQACNGYLASAN